MEQSCFRSISEGIVYQLITMREREKQTEKYAHPAQLTTKAKSVGITFGLNFFI